MLDINSPDFRINFSLKNGSVGVIGRGYVGSAVEKFFSEFCKVRVFDKFKESTSSFEEVVALSEIVFVCVPTPMKQSGECHTDIVEGVIEDIVDKAVEIGRGLNTFIVVVKSTVNPGFTESVQKKHPGLRLVFSPEFLTEANSLDDFVKSNRVVFGGSIEDALVLSSYFRDRFGRDRVDKGEVALVRCTPTTAELVKLFTNAILMTKVLFANEFYTLCQAFEGVQYDVVREIACLDKRIGSSHLKVPGPDGEFGAGGHCFPKDINNVRFMFQKLGLKEKIFTAVIDRNNEVRQNKDWLEMSGRAVIDE